jgi:ABC-type sugar transport system permease subunit
VIAALVGVGPAYTDVALTTTIVVAQDPQPAPGQGPEFGEASPIALVIVILLGIALIFLVRSMTKHLRKVPASFDEPPKEPDQG